MLYVIKILSQCIEDWGIESTPVCLTEPSQNYPKKKKIPRNSSPTNLECKPRGLMT